MDAVAINKKYRNTVVDINAVSIIQDDDQKVSIVQVGTGFFIEGNKIVTSAHVVLLPVDVQRIPSGTIKGIVPVERILVTVYHVNGTEDNFVYNAKIIGIDRMVDIALLDLLPTQGSPKIICQQHLQWIDNKEVAIGSTVYTIGNTVGADVRSFSAGVVRDNRYPFIANPYLPEQVTFDAPVGSGNSGGPLLTADGKVVGVIQGSILDNGNEVDLNRSVASSVAVEIIANLLCPTIQWTELINDVFGSFYRRVNSAVDLDFEYVTADLFLRGINDNINPNQPLTYNQVIGVIVNKEPLTSNPLVGIISKGDILTQINDIVIGLDSPNQTSTGTPLLKIPPGDYVKLSYLKASENYKHKHHVHVQVVAIPLEDEIDSVI